MQFFSRPVNTQDDWQTRLETITPQRAKQILADSNFDNRKLKLRTVENYAAMMRAGEWRTTPETLSVATNGRLLNGQHRLHAIVRSGVACTFLFVYGVDESVYAVLDRGARRSVADAIQRPQKLTEAASLLARLHAEKPSVLDHAIEHAAVCIAPAHTLLMEACNTSSRTFGAAPFRLAATARIMEGADAEYVCALYRKLNLGDTEHLPLAGHAAMRRYVTGSMPPSGGLKMQMERLCIAWPLFDPEKADTKLLRSVSLPVVRAEVLKATDYSDA